MKCDVKNMENSFKGFVSLKFTSNANVDNLWVEIKGFWMFFYKKVSIAIQYFFPLHLKCLSITTTEDGFQNNIFIELSGAVGMYSFTLTTTNRVELLHLYETIKNGTKQFLDSYNSKNFKKDLSYDCEIASGFMNLSKQKKRLTLTKHGLNLDTQTFPFDQIISFSTISNFLPNNSKIYITLKDDKQPKEIVCSSTSDAMDVMSSFLFLSKADFNMII